VGGQSIGHAELKKNGVFVVPGLMRVIVVKKTATKERKGITPIVLRQRSRLFRAWLVPEEQKDTEAWLASKNVLKGRAVGAGAHEYGTHSALTRPGVDPYGSRGANIGPTGRDLPQSSS
jgi:hypothetical protein